MRLGITRAHRLGAAVLASGALVVAAPLAAPAYAAPAPPKVTAKGAYLLDNTANKKLWSKGADTRRQMASTTKVMTAITVLGTAKLDLNKKVTIKKDYRSYVARKGASTADLKTGDKVTVKQLLYAMMLPSGCDAAMALADTYGTGTTVSARTKSFIKKMNSNAVKLGLKNTKYDSFDGISAAGKNYTTPRDAAVLTRKAMSYSTFRGIVKSQKTVQKATNGRTYTWYNTNKLLGSYSGAVGVKTGTGTSAGPCLIFAATRNGRTIIGVVLHSSSGNARFTDATKMLNYAFKTSSSSAAGTLKLRKLPAGAQSD